jgi:iron complex transport system ATP-binding protein
VDGLDLDVVTGTATAVIGPNGRGKSTLLRALGRLLKPRAGRVLLDGAEIDRLPTREVARRLGLLPQSPSAPEGLTVADLVARGRHPHQRWFRQWSADDEAVVAAAMRETGVLDLGERPVDALSGGQRQRAWIAMALAQGTDLLLLDEPTTHLDLAHAVDVLDLVDRLSRERGRTVLMVLHDLALAARYADRLVAMKDGAVVAQGAPRGVLTPDLLLEVFGLRAVVLPDPVCATGVVVVPVGARR